MEISPENKAQIKSAFANLKTKDDLLVLLNIAKELLYGEKLFPFQLKQLNYHAHFELNENRYFKFSIKKKSGATRTIHAPNKGLKEIQKCLNLVLQIVYEDHQSKAATGFVPNKSIVDNAKVHTNMHYVYNIDLKDFFPSIEQARVRARLQLAPFNLNDANGTTLLANVIANICCHQMEVERWNNDTQNWEIQTRKVLPQGAPTSPTLTNIICQQLDFYLTAVAKRFGLRYSRYADDITFSSLHNVYQKDSDFLIELHRIIKAQNFHIKEAKTRLQKHGYKQEVTGLIVNEKANVPLRYIKALRMWLYLWERYGFERANGYFLPEYLKDKGHIKDTLPNMMQVIAGKLEYLKMVKGYDNATYLGLKSRFDKLTKPPKINTNQSNILYSPFEDTREIKEYKRILEELDNIKKIQRTKHLNEVLDVLLKYGLHKAMKLYTPK
ncbi:MAG: hypothetical protein RLZZ175_2549 [Bacteroidota bacterium]|jgi:RNA-directed DNA polymerase